LLGKLIYVPNPDPEAVVAILKKIRTSDAEGLKLRWQAGKCMVALRDGKKRLPNGVLSSLEEKSKVSRRELQRYMRLASRYPTEDELRHCVAVHRNWHDLVMNALSDEEPEVENPEDFEGYPDESEHESGGWEAGWPGEVVLSAARFAEDRALLALEEFGNIGAKERKVVLEAVESAGAAWERVANVYRGDSEATAKQMLDFLKEKIGKRKASEQPAEDKELLDVNFGDLLEVG
jgi:hypothetical protein